ncbi:GIY-YIG nuclease family protein [Streptomyces sp. NPDC004532]
MAQGRPYIPQNEQRHRAVQGPWTKYLKYFDADDPAKLPILYTFRDFELAGIAVTSETAEIAVKLGRLQYERNTQKRSEEQQRREEIWAANAASLAAQKLLDDHPDGIVYYVRRGNFIKIGTTRSFSARMNNIKPDEILAVEPGSYSLENQRHQQFEEHRHGRDERGTRSEYFHPSDELKAHILALREEHGIPPQVGVSIGDGRKMFGETANQS